MTLEKQVLKDALAEFIAGRCCDLDTDVNDEHNVAIYISRRYSGIGNIRQSEKFNLVIARVREARRQLKGLT